MVMVPVLSVFMVFRPALKHAWQFAAQEDSTFGVQEVKPS